MQGRKVLYEGAAKGSSRRSKLTVEEQNWEYAVLNYLEGGETAKAGALRSATGAGRGLLEGMVKKKWLVREALAEERDAKPGGEGGGGWWSRECLALERRAGLGWRQGAGGRVQGVGRPR